MLDLTHLLIVEAWDTEEAVTDAIGFSPLTNPTDGIRYDAELYQFPWDHAEVHSGGWLELMLTVGNGGYALFLLVAPADGLTSELRALCRVHGGR